MRKKLPVFEDYVQNPDAMNVAVFMGCASAILDDYVLDSMIRVLKKSGFNVTVLEHNCCGLPMIAEGLYDLAKDTARKVVTAFADTSTSTSVNQRYDAIVTACASCTMMLKRFGGLLAEEDCEVRDAAARVSAITYDIGEFLAKFVDEEVFSKEKLDIRAVYHNPCHLAAAGVKDSSRVLGRIVSEFAELSDGCCGGAGAYSFLHSGSSDMIFDRKIEEIRRIDPDVVVTTCPSCELQFRHGIARNDLRCDVMNIVEVVDLYYRHLQGDIP